MIINANEIKKGETLETQVCVIGAGAAGLTLAQAFEKNNISVILLEAGDLTPTTRSQKVYSGTDSGIKLNRNPEHLIRSRLRYFGGTTNHWTGWCAEYDEEDFVEKEWVPFSNWPIAKKQIQTYYDEARSLCDIKKNETLTSEVEDLSKAPDLSFFTRVFELSPPTRFGPKFLPLVKKSQKIKLLTNAYATSIQSAENGSTVSYLEVNNLKKKPFKIKAKFFILATGGFENARLLLNSNSVHKHGLGNDQDNVGRYYMEHPEVDIDLSGNKSLGNFFDKLTPKEWNRLRKAGRAQYPSYSPSFSVRKENRILNSAFLLTSIDKIPDHPVIKFDKGKSPKYFSVLMKAEQSPNKDSFVALTSEKDEWGVRRLNHHLAFSEFDKLSIKKSITLFARAFGYGDYGRLRKDFDEADLWIKDAKIWGHPCGTTRMSQLPKDGVVDANCKVHGVENLFVSGSSVFTTASCVNPTLTIVALALRLADHIKVQMLAGQGI